MSTQTPDPTQRTMLTFALAAVALAMFVLATQVSMPLRAILLATGVSCVIFLVVLTIDRIRAGR